MTNYKSLIEMRMACFLGGAAKSIEQSRVLGIELWTSPHGVDRIRKVTGSCVTRVLPFSPHFILGFVPLHSFHISLFFGYLLSDM